MAKAKSKYGYKYLISDNCRLNKHQKSVLLKWITSHKAYQHRKPTVVELIKECRRPGSKLNCLMEQNVHKAAYHYWYERAQYLLRHVEIIKVNIITKDVIREPVRVYIPTKIEKCGRIPERNYAHMHRVANSPLLKQSVLERAHADFQAWLYRFERYAEFLDEFSDVINAYKRLARRLRKGA